MPAFLSRFSPRTLVAVAAVLGVVALGQAGVLLWVFWERATPASSAVAPVQPAEEDAEALEAELLAAEAEKRLIADLSQPKPKPPATPQSRVMDLIAEAKELRDRGDTGTAMVRLRQAQGIFSRYPPIISEMALTYEKMELVDKAIEQWRRIYEMGEQAGIYYAAAEAKLLALQLPDIEPEEPAHGSILEPGRTADAAPVFSLGDIGLVEEKGSSPSARRLKLAVPILQGRTGSRVDPRLTVIQVFFYETLKDGSVAETNASVTPSWSRRMNDAGEVQPVDWSTADPETLEVTYVQPEIPRETRNYYGYSVRVYYKGILHAKFAQPAGLLTQFIPPIALPSSDLPQ